MKNKIEVSKGYGSLRIHINGILHLAITTKNHDGVQSWYEGNKKRLYFIEFYRKKGSPILLEYTEVENWKNILTLLDENL